jgi:hypothetical protein
MANLGGGEAPVPAPEEGADSDAESDDAGPPPLE